MSSQFIFFIVVATVVGLFAFFRYYYSAKQFVCRKLKKAMGVPMRSFISGEIAKVAGKVELIGKPLIAPLSGRTCCYYQLKIEQYHSGNKGGHWSTIIEDEQCSDFFLCDGRTKAAVQQEDIKSYLVQDWSFESGFMQDAPARLQVVLRNYGYSSENFLGMNKSLHYKEGVLEQGEMVAVVGRGTWKSASEAGLNSSEKRILWMEAPDDDKIYLSDDPESVEIQYQALKETANAMIYK